MPGPGKGSTNRLQLSGTPCLFTFGFGLSYTDFAFSNLKLSDTEFSSSDTLRLEVDVENIGAYLASRKVPRKLSSWDKMVIWESE